MAAKPRRKPTDLDPRGVRPAESWDALDKRCVAARIARQEFAHHLADLGGEEATSHAERALLAHTIPMRLWLRSVETRLMEGKPVDDLMGVYSTVLNTLHSAYRTLGLKRRPKDVPSLQDYLRQKSLEKESDANGT